MNILENELVLKYFGCDGNDQTEHRHPQPSCELLMGKRVLLAMQEPINLGEKYLYVQNDGNIREMEMVKQADHPPFFFHPMFWRLPSRFQRQEKKECVCQEYRNSGKGWACGASIHQPAPSDWKCCMHPNGIDCPVCRKSDAVEEKIREILDFFYTVSRGRLELFLRELVRLARP